jgi:hypothetical protein
MAPTSCESSFVWAWTLTLLRSTDSVNSAFSVFFYISTSGNLGKDTQYADCEVRGHCTDMPVIPVNRVVD